MQTFHCWGLDKEADVGAMHEEEAARHYVQQTWTRGDPDESVLVTVLGQDRQVTHWRVLIRVYAETVGEAQRIDSPFKG